MLDAVSNTVCGGCMLAAHALRSNAVAGFVNHARVRRGVLHLVPLVVIVHHNRWLVRTLIMAATASLQTTNVKMKQISHDSIEYVVCRGYLQFTWFGVIATVQTLDRLVEVDSALLTMLQFSPVLKWHNWLSWRSDYLLARITADFPWEDWLALGPLVVQIAMCLIELLPLQYATIFIHLRSASSAQFIVVVAWVSRCQQSNSGLRTWILTVNVVATHGLIFWIASRRERYDRYVLLATALAAVPELLSLAFYLHLRRKTIRLLQIDELISALDALRLHCSHNWRLASVNVRIFFLTWLHEIAPTTLSER